MDLAQAGDVLRLIRNSKLEYLHLSVKLEEISRSGFVEELNNVRIIGQKGRFYRKSEYRCKGPTENKQTSAFIFGRWPPDQLSRHE